jgi:mannose-6-phosphate isomerase-like protein (cupin superfamily)
MDISIMKVNGRHPQEKNKFLLEHECQFVMFITKGEGKVYTDDQVFKAKPQDVIFVPKETKFAVEGNFEHITVDVPAFYPEQSEEV